MSDQQAQEQGRDFQRAESDLDRLLNKVETGMAGAAEAKEIREIINFLSGTQL